jgi:hypothetical protein
MRQKNGSKEKGYKESSKEKDYKKASLVHF